MEASSSAQDVHRCDLCKTAIVDSYCDVCHVNLCKPCIGEHISDEYDKHKIVAFQNRGLTYIYPKCKEHTDRNCEFQCKDCDSLVCSLCMASEQHRGHIFEKVSEEYKSMKKTIKNDEEKLRDLSQEHKKIELDLNKQLGNLDGIYTELTKNIFAQKKKWDEVIKTIINKMETEIREIKSKHKDTLEKHLDENEKKQDSIKKALLDLQKIKESNTVSQVTEYSSKIGEFSKFPSKIEIPLAKFKPGPIDCDKLVGFFGKITPLSTTSDKNAVSIPNLYQLTRISTCNAVHISRRAAAMSSNRQPITGIVRERETPMPENSNIARGTKK